jgi:hypothetical protein
LGPISLACAKKVPSEVGVTPIALLISLLSMVMSVGDPAGAPAWGGKARHRSAAMNVRSSMCSPVSHTS